MRLALLCLSLVLLQKDPTASDAWASPPANGAIAVYATITNPTMYDVYLVSGTSDAAGRVELISGGQPVSNIAVPAYGSAELKPGAALVRLSELKRDVKAGEEVTVTLETDGGIAIAITAVVK
jgi:hypothetical protein